MTNKNAASYYYYLKNSTWCMQTYTNTKLFCFERINEPRSSSFLLDKKWEEWALETCVSLF